MYILMNIRIFREEYRNCNLKTKTDNFNTIFEKCTHCATTEQGLYIAHKDA